MSHVSERNYLTPNRHHATLRAARMAEPKPERYQFGGRDVALVSIDDTNGEPICRNEKCALSKDPQAKELYAAIKKTYSFFKEFLKYDGIDGEGEIAPFELHWEEDNAAWMCQGTAAGQQCLWSFNDHFITEKIVTHEWTHGIIDRRSQLAGVGEPAALNEALADIMAVSCYIWNHGNNIRQAAVWQIEDIRDLTEHHDYTNYQALKRGEKPSDQNDYGHVHDNSKIMSHAFCLAVHLLFTKMPKHNQALEIAVKVVWSAMAKMEYNETFNRFALNAIMLANQLDEDVGQTFAEAFIHVRVIKYELPKELSNRSISPPRARLPGPQKTPASTRRPGTVIRTITGHAG